jgi:hypothetical protein
MQWLLLVMSLPTRHATGRVRVWRALKQAGCGSLRDGVFLLPARAEAQTFFSSQVAEIVAAGGQAQVLSLSATDATQEDAFRGLFDRSAEYGELQAAIDGLRGKVKRGAAATLAREAAKLRKAFTAISAVDYFPGPAREQVGAALEEIQQQISAKLNPDEPRAVSGKLKRLDRADYQGRAWATRKHLWVDRMASAWLIARFIDTQATFKWLAKPGDCPKKALGFDFDGATFTHVGSRVTFEVLLASFGLDEDAALNRIGGIVHFLDAGGVPMAEAAGLEAVLKGLREQAANDDALLTAAMLVFDGLYAAFGKAD